MTTPYILGFARESLKIPKLGNYDTNITKMGRHEVIWSRAPNELFKSKKDYLLGMLGFYEELMAYEISFLPVQAGIRVGRESDLLKLLKKYEQMLEQGFDKVCGCREYFLYLSILEKEFDQTVTESLSETRKETGTGKAYFDKIRSRLRQREYITKQITEIVKELNQLLGDCVKEYQYNHLNTINGEEKPDLELCYLVPISGEAEFSTRVARLSRSKDWEVNITGPWPPFHFSQVTLQTEGYLVRKKLTWGDGT